MTPGKSATRIGADDRRRGPRRGRRGDRACSMPARRGSPRRAPDGWHGQPVAEEGGPALLPPQSDGADPRRPGRRDVVGQGAVQVRRLGREPRFAAAGFRAVPGAIVRRGAFIGQGAVLMPSFVNIGAYVGEGTMVDTWATVGSCAQIGRNVHISGGTGIGGVLEPLQAGPVIIEDDCFIGARSEVAEGVVVEQGAVISMGVFIGASTKIVDRATGEVFMRPRARLIRWSCPARCPASRAERRPEPRLRRHRQARRRPDPRRRPASTNCCGTDFGRKVRDAGAAATSTRAATMTDQIRHPTWAPANGRCWSCSRSSGAAPSSSSTSPSDRCRRFTLVLILRWRSPRRSCWSCCCATGRRLAVPQRRTLVPFLILALLNNVVPFCLFAWGQQQIASGLASILNATTPLWAVLVAHFLTADEKATPLKVAGVAARLRRRGSDDRRRLPARHWRRQPARPARLPGRDPLLRAGRGLCPPFPADGRFADRGVGRPAQRRRARSCCRWCCCSSRPGSARAAGAEALGLAHRSGPVLDALAYILYFRLIAAAGATNAMLVTFLIPVTAILLGATVARRSAGAAPFRRHGADRPG